MGPRHQQVTVAAVLALALLAGCEGPGPMPAGENGVAAVVPVWPAPPARPRIRYLGTIAGASDIGAHEQGFAALLSFLKGTESPTLAQPYGIAVDRDNRLFVVDSVGRRVHVFDQAAGRYQSFPEDQSLLESPIDIALDATGKKAFVTDSTAGVVHVFTAPDWKYQRSFGAGQLERPTGLAMNSDSGELLVVDTINERLAVYDARSLALKRVVGGPGTGDNAFHYPTNVAIAPDGNILVTDALNFRVQVLNARFEFIGSFGAVGDGPGHFSRPKGLAVDNDGNVYVVDALFDNVQIFDAEHRLLLAFGAPGSKPGEFWLPSGIATGADGRIYVADSYNQRVQIFERVGGAGQ